MWGVRMCMCAHTTCIERIHIHIPEMDKEMEKRKTTAFSLKEEDVCVCVCVTTTSYSQCEPFILNLMCPFIREEQLYSVLS